MSSEWELDVATKLSTNFKDLYFSSDLREQGSLLGISSKNRVTIASVVGLDHLSSNLQVIILCLIT